MFIRSALIVPRSSNRDTALPASHGLPVLGRDAFDPGAVGGLAIARIAGHHAILVQEVEVLTLALQAHYDAFFMFR
jgi:hypothetical protein